MILGKVEKVGDTRVRKRFAFFPEVIDDWTLDKNEAAKFGDNVKVYEQELVLGKIYPAKKYYKGPAHWKNHSDLL